MNSKRMGKWIKHTIGGESFHSYLPPTLPLTPPIELQNLYPLMERATKALSELESATTSIPNQTLFIYMYVRKEALLSSQIEGTQGSLSDLLLFEHNIKPTVSLNDIEEVSNYVKAIHFAFNKLSEDFPLSLRLLKETHKILLAGTRGAERLPGEFRRSQNWIGGTRPGNALFVPPAVEHLPDCLKNFELFLHDASIPTLIKAGIAHVQFESIHPFLDGNGRLGRLLTLLLLFKDTFISSPILYVSLYLKQQKKTYYDLLQEVRNNGSWDAWLEFFLCAIEKSALQATTTIQTVEALFNSDNQIIRKLGRIRFSCALVFEYMKQLPRVTVPQLEKQLSLSAPTIRSALEAMKQAGILIEITEKQRDRIYVYQHYLDVLSEGSE